MPRVVGIDPGTVSIDLCGLDEGRVFADESLPTSAALADPSAFVSRLEALAPIDLVAGPSGYGLPCVTGHALTERDLRLAFLAPEAEPGGIAGLRSLARTLGRSRLPVVFTPGVMHLTTVPSFRKVNRIDMGTADKVCAAVLAAHDQASRRGCAIDETAFVLLELGGAFTAALALDRGRIVDGIGGSSGPLGMRGAGALDGEVAFLAGAVSKSLVFNGGAAAVAGVPDLDARRLLTSTDTRVREARDAYFEGAVKAVAAMFVSAPDAVEVIVSGRVASLGGVCETIAGRLSPLGIAVPVVRLNGFATRVKQAAQGAALLADGLAGGSAQALVEVMAIREARGDVLEHLFVMSREDAERRLGIA